MSFSSRLIPILAEMGKMAIATNRQIGSVAVFLCKGIIHMLSSPLQIEKILEQIFFIGAKSLFIICITGIFTGMVLGLQGYYTLIKFGSEDMLGSAVALSLVREMGPVFTSIMVTARAGSSMAAEIGLMRISEQIDALKTMNINPIKFLFSPRLAAGIISLPLLTAIFDLTGILGGYLSKSILINTDSGVYFSQVKSSIQITDINGGFIKSLCFSIVLITICCFKGYFTHKQKNNAGARSVGVSTTSAVVLSCTLILMTDYVITSLLL